MSLLDQSGVTGGGLGPYKVHALFVNMDNMWTEKFGNYDCLVVNSYSELYDGSIYDNLYPSFNLLASCKEIINILSL